jgi:SAM-dependent methyltransferase
MEAKDWDRKWRTGHPEPHAEPGPLLAEELGRICPGQALDVGCGNGRNAVWLAERGWRVTAVDFSKVALQRGRALAGERGVEVEWILADVREWAFPAGGFELVLVSYLQIPAAERRDVLARAAAALAPHGTLLVVGHDLSNLTEGWGGPKDPEVLFTPEDVVSELPGLAIERAERIRRQVDDSEGRHVAIDAVVKAARRVA